MHVGKDLRIWSCIEMQCRGYRGFDSLQVDHSSLGDFVCVDDGVLWWSDKFSAIVAARDGRSPQQKL